MKAFFDTSVFVAAFLEDHVHHEPSFTLFSGAGLKNTCCAAHTLAEVYSTLTRMPGKRRLDADQAMLLVESIEERCEIVALDFKDYIAVIREAADAGITGGLIYDALLGKCALKARATKIYTWDVSDFRRLSGAIAEKVTTP